MTTQPRRRPAARVLLAVGDGAAWAAGLGLATWVRYAFEETRVSVSGLLIVIVVAVVVQWLIGVLRIRIGVVFRWAVWMR